MHVAVPATFLYTFPRDLYISFHKRQDWLRIPYERNVYYYLYCADLFRLFENGDVTGQDWKKSMETYRRYFANADVYTEENLEAKFRQHISQRYSIYHEMDKLFHFNPDFFEEYPLLVKWNFQRHCLYVRDGNNRLAFLLSKGIHNVVCRMTKEDYAQWMSSQEMQRYVQVSADQQAQARLILRWLGKIDLLKKVNTILFFSSDFILSDAFSKMGLQVVDHEQAGALDKADLVWLDLTCGLIEKKDKMERLLEGYENPVVCVGAREDIRQFMDLIQGEPVIPISLYWNAGKEMGLGLIRKGSGE